MRAGAAGCDRQVDLRVSRPGPTSVRLGHRMEHTGHPDDSQLSPRSSCPWQNPYAECLVGTVRRECLDHVIVFREAHLPPGSPGVCAVL